MNPHRNVLMIIADQFRADCLGASGNQIIQTPHLDALASAGTLFSQAYVQTAPCGPSRMCIYTGRYACSTRSLDNMTPLMEAEDNLAYYLRQAGQTPVIAGYNDYAVDPRILPPEDYRTHELRYDNYLPGFDVLLKHEYHSPEYFDYLRQRGYPEEWCGPAICTEHDIPAGGPGEHLPLCFPAHYRAEDSEGRFLTDQCAAYMRRQAGHGWFLSINYIKPHPPRICPSPYHRMYRPDDMPAVNRRPEELDATHPYLKGIDRQAAGLDDKHMAELQACYYGMVSEVDDYVGILLNTLKETGQWEDTLIVFTSDHGEYLGDHYFTEKTHFYDSAIHVPCIIRDPSREADVTRGQVMEGLVESIDLAPTMMTWLGLEPPERMQGKSLMGLLHGDAGSEAKREIHYEFSFRQRFKDDPAIDPDTCLLWVLRDASFKYVQFGPEEMAPLLFDIKEDPEEQHNLAGDADMAPVLAEYAQRMLRWRMKHEDQRMERWAARLR